jgi:RNA polymerase sigma-54 factor
MGGTANDPFGQDAGFVGGPEPQPAGIDGVEAMDGNGLDLGQAWSLDAGGRAGSDDPDDDRGKEHAAATGTTLREHLMQQLAGSRCTARDRALLELLIDELHEDGYLRTDLAEVAAALPAELAVDPDELRTALRLLHSFDPAGVGARSVPECLLLQLQQAGQRIGAAPRTIEAARRIIEQHLDLLAARDFGKLLKLLRCDDQMLRDARHLIQSLDPKPGNRFAQHSPFYVVPDVVVRKTREGWRAFLNPEVIPRLRVNDLYARILKSQRGGTGPAGPRGAAESPGTDNRNGVANSLSSQLQEARWLVKNVQQRFETILRVSQEIVDRQSAFFSHGAVAMRPLVLREIAEAVGLHESTISRVTTQKYMLTPYGTLELKYFFGSHVATESGGAASSTAIRALIKQLIDEEDNTQPLSDSRIAEVLGEQGIVVARRTVAKYREALKLPPVSQRKAL